MTLKFRNPANGDVVEISHLSCVAAFFLGPLYLLAYGFTWHAIVWVILAFGPALVWHESALAISLPFTCLLYSLMIHPLLVNKLRAQGWLPTRGETLANPSQRGYGDYADSGRSSSTGRSLTGIVLAPTQRSSSTVPTVATITTVATGATVAARPGPVGAPSTRAANETPISE